MNLFLPPPPSTLSEAYRNPYGETHHYYGSRNLLDPNAAYCTHRAPPVKTTFLSTVFVTLVNILVVGYTHMLHSALSSQFQCAFHLSVQMVTCLFLVLALLCPTGTYHRVALPPASTALTASTVEAVSLSLQTSKYLFLVLFKMK